MSKPLKVALINLILDVLASVISFPSPLTILLTEKLKLKSKIIDIKQNESPKIKS